LTQKSAIFGSVWLRPFSGSPLIIPDLAVVADFSGLGAIGAMGADPLPPGFFLLQLLVVLS
jgi:hypothetical protein